MINKFISIVLFCFVLLIAGCGKSPENEILIGAILPLTGSGSQDGEYQKNGIDLAIKEINKNGGINGSPIRIHYEDSHNEAKEGITAMNTMLNRHKIDIVLSTMSGVSAPLSSYVGNKMPVLLFVTVASVPKITLRGDNIYRAFVTSDIESRIMADFMFDQGFKKMAVLYVNDDYGVGGKEEFASQFRIKGGEVIFDSAFEKGSTDHRSLIFKALEGKPDGVFVVGYDKSFATLIQQLGQLGKGVQIAATSPLSVPSWRSLAGDAAEGAYLVSSYFKSDPEDLATKAFDQEYKSAYQSPSNYLAGSAYVSVQLLAAAMRSSGTDREQVQKGLLEIKDHPTILGKISFQSNREASFPVRIARITDGKVKPVE